MKTKNLFNLALLIAVSFLASCTGCNRVQPNYEGVLMTNYGRSGKTDFTKVTGSQGLLGPGSELYQVALYEQKADPTSVKITSRNSGEFTVDPNYTYQVFPTKGVDIIFNYKHVGLDDELLENIETAALNPLVLNAYREEARSFSTDSLLNNLSAYETAVEKRLAVEFEKKGFSLLNLTSGLKPPASMIEAIESRNNTKIEAEKVQDQLEVATKLQQKARIDAETNRIKATGLPKEVLQEKWIEALRTTSNKVIVTDGKTPILIN